MMMDDRYIFNALAGVLNTPARPAALSAIAYLKYWREAQPCKLSEDTVFVNLRLRGFEYKRRYPKPKFPPPVDTDAITAALNDSLPVDLRVLETLDFGEAVRIIIKEEKPNGSDT